MFCGAFESLYLFEECKLKSIKIQCKIRKLTRKIIKSEVETKRIWSVRYDRVSKM
jgi:hypothetical protein